MEKSESLDIQTQKLIKISMWLAREHKNTGITTIIDTQSRD